MYHGILPVFWYRFCSKVFVFEIPEKASESFLPEVVFPKLLRSKVLDFNVCRKQ